MIDDLIKNFNYDVAQCEQKMQIFIRQWIVQKTPLANSFFHFANERRTSWSTGKTLKAMGVVAGVVDIFISLSSADGKYKGLWIELKSPGKKPTKQQLDFISQRKAEGYWAIWSDNIETVIRAIKLFYNLPD